MSAARSKRPYETTDTDGILLCRAHVAVVFSRAVCRSNPSVAAADRVRIGLSSFTPINAALWIAEEKGLFKKHGIES